MFFYIVRRTASVEKVRAAVFDLLAKHPKAKYDKLTSQKAFKEIGLNSLDTIELIVDLEENLKVDLIDDEIVSINTCDEAITIFSKHLDSKFHII